MIQSGVYEIKNTVNGHRYIGSSSKIPNRLQGHRRELIKNAHINSHLQCAWNKYGEENFIFGPILYCDSDNSLLYEQMCLDGLHPEYNIAKDAVAFMLGLKQSKTHRQKIEDGIKKYHAIHTVILSEEHKRKVGLASKGHIVTEITREKIRNKLMDHSVTKETRKRMSEAENGRVRSDEARKKTSESLRRYYETHVKVLAEETKQKISQTLKGHSYNLGYRHTEETKRKLSNAQKGKVASEETRLKMCDAQKIRRAKERGKLWLPQ